MGSGKKLALAQYLLAFMNAIFVIQDIVSSGIDIITIGSSFAAGFCLMGAMYTSTRRIDI